MMMRRLRGLSVAACCGMLTACVSDRLVLTPVPLTALEQFALEDHVAALTTYRLSCEAIAKRPPNAIVGEPPLAAPALAWQKSCRDAGVVPLRPESARAFFERDFIPLLATNNGVATGLFTGYYVPETPGSLTRSARFHTPVFGMPDDLTSAPYFTRAEIYSGALEGRAQPIAWVDDPVALFFIEIQGSGVLRLDHGKHLTIGYAGKNNQPFIPIGRVMAERGLIPKDRVSLQSIKQWLYDHPDEMQAVLEENPSYVFFRALPDDIVRGGQGVGLTDGRSLAVDTRFIPYGMPLYVDTNVVSTPLGTPRRFRQLMIAQDTGGAIRGPVRGDVYFGRGEGAERSAGGMQQQGRYTLLVPKPVYEEIQEYLDE